MKDLRDPTILLYDARSQLRARLRPLEPEGPALASNSQVTLDDTGMLMLLERLELAFAADEAESRARYAAAIGVNAAAPTFDALDHDGWFQIVFGRVVTPIRISVAARHVSSLAPGLTALLSDRFAVAYDFSAVPRGTKQVDDVVGRLETDDLRFVDIDCRTPAWVAARLWERQPAVPDPLRWWLDRWNLLGRPLFLPSDVWDGAMARDFINLVIDRLEREPALIGWADVRQAVADQGMRAAAQPGPASLDSIPPVPGSVVARARWLGDPALVGIPQMRSKAFEEVGDLVSLVAGDIEKRRYAAAPDAQMVRLVDVALDRPDLVQILVDRALRHPLLIAEFLVQPATCALGCWLLLLRSAGQMLPLDDSDNSEFAMAALQDGLALLRRYLFAEDPGELAAEAAALLTAGFDSTGRPRRLASAKAGVGIILEVLRDLGTGAAPVAESLAAARVPDSLDAPAFLAALELVAAAGLAEVVAPDPLPNAYIAAVRAGHSQLSADRVAPAGAATLFHLAKRCGAARLSQFLNPVDWRAELRKVGEGDYVGRWRIARSLATSTRFLANAVRGLRGEAPSDLIGSLAAHVSAGSEDDLPNGKVWAFASETLSLPWSRPAEATMGTLLGQALSTVEGDSREPLLVACLELREPALLADLYRAAPREMRARIEARIQALAIDQAIPASSLTTLSARIDALLDAGLVGPAEEQIKAAAQATTWGKVTERPRIEFGQRLRLLFLNADWAAIGAATIPAGLPQLEREACERILENYQAVAALQDGNADPGLAIVKLERLVRSNPSDPGYQVNLFAAKILQTLGTDPFPNLSPGERQPARVLVAEIEKWMETAPATEHDRNICNANLAMLDLAIGEPGRALGRLLALPPDQENAVRAAYLAVAYGRLGRAREAHATLDSAIASFGDTLLLEAARGHLVGHPSTGGLGASDRAIFALDVEQMHRIRAAMVTFAKSSARDQAEILRGGGDALPALVTDHVDSVLSGIASLAPLINRNVLPDDEDDITAVIKQLLNARLDHLGWSTPDQSKGGYTPRGNCGERDLILVQGLTELAVMEAVIVSGSIPKEELTAHFRKLLGYGDCPLYFHLTYAWLPDTARLMEVLESIAVEEAPPGYSFEGKEPSVRVGNRPSGFTARYRVAGRVIQVVFRVLDLGQNRLRDAAANSVKKPNSPSRKPRAQRPAK